LGRELTTEEIEKIIDAIGEKKIGMKQLQI
jgi:hypothetical protein